MFNKTLMEKLFFYNMHIGHKTVYNSQLNYYILGQRFNFFIIDLSKSFLLLKKVLLFLKHLAINNGTLLFYYSQYSNLSLIYKCVLLSISKSSNQQLVTYNWVYGTITNYFFMFFYFIRDITETWVIKSSYLFNFKKNHNDYYNHNIDERNYTSFQHTFFTYKDSSKNLKKKKLYETWYNQWIKKQNSYDIWQYKKKALKQTNFLKQCCLNDFNNIFKKKKMFNFKYFFLKLFYYLNLKKKDPFFLKNETVFLLKYSNIHKRFLYYWRFMLYFKYFNNYLNLPDAMFSIFPDNNDLPMNEYSSNNLVSISLIDTNSQYSNIHYPIISNDDSLVIVLFYFTLFSNIFLENQLSLYNFFKNQ